jgi:hypothetical protein
MSDNQDPIAAALDKCLRDKVAVAISAADSSAKHYEDYYKSFLGIDTKAQSNATISGLVLAATAAFIKDGRVTALAQSGRWWIVLVLLPPAFALLAVIVSLVGARITSIVFPFDAKEQIREAKHLADLDCNEFSQMHIRNYYLARLEHWEKALEDIEKKIATKAQWVLNGQRFMIASLSFLFILFIVVLSKS